MIHLGQSCLAPEVGASNAHRTVQAYTYLTAPQAYKDVGHLSVESYSTVS